MISRSPEIIVYLGSGSDYLIVARRYCSCEAFIRGLARGAPGCKHVYGARMAVRAGRVRVLEPGPGVVGRIVWEVLTGGLTGTLRKLLYGPRLGAGHDVGYHDYECVDSGEDHEG